MSKRKIAAILAGTSAVGIINSGASVAFASEREKDFNYESYSNIEPRAVIKGPYNISGIGSWGVDEVYYDVVIADTSKHNKIFDESGNNIYNKHVKYGVLKDQNGNIIKRDGYLAASSNGDASGGFYETKGMNTKQSTVFVANGELLTGYVKISSNRLFYLDETNGSVNRGRPLKASADRWVTSNLGGIYGRRYIKESGEIVTGKAYVNGVRYYFDKYGVEKGRAIEINVTNSVVIEEGKKYDIMDGVASKDSTGSNANNKITIELGGFDPDNPQVGVYTITYTLRDGEQVETATRTITVKGKPVISGVNDVTIYAGTKFNALEGITAADAEGVEIQLDESNVKYSEGFDPNAPKVGNYTVIYTVTDKKNYTTEKVRNVRVIKRNDNAPTIHGVGNKTINVNEEFDPMHGVVVDDREDNPANVIVSVTGPSGHQANASGKYTFADEGQYTFTYTATDLDGNETVVQRVITVKQAIYTVFRDAVWSSNDLIMTGKMDVLGTTADANMTKIIVVRDSQGQIAKTITTTNRDYNDGQTGFEVDFRKTDVFDGLKVGETYNVFVRGTLNGKTYEEPLVQSVSKSVGVTNINDLAPKEFNDYKITFRTGGNNQIQIVKQNLADTQKPVINAPEISVVRGDSSFNLKNGITITDNVDSQEDLLGRLEINEGNFDINQAGTYQVTYTVRDAAGNVSETVTRTVIVTPKTTTPPTITGATDVSIVQGTSFNEKAGVTARAEDGEDLTSKIQVDKKVNVNQVGEQTITYTVTDRDNNTTTVTRKVTVTAKPAENKLPTIYAPMRHEIYVGDNFNPLDIATAVDPEDGPITLTEKNIVFNKVNTQKAGEYEVKYEVIDRNKGRRTKVITVVVKERPVTDRKPTINFPEKTVIKVGSTFNPIADVTATDYKGQPITIENKHVSWNKVNTSAPGDYQVKYTVTDSEGNTKIAYRTVTVEGSAITPPSTDKKPVISFKDNIVINVGDVFNPLAGVTAKDYKGQNIVLNESNVAWNKVNTAQAGTYQVKYRVTDSEGNNKIVYRTVIVKGFTGLRGDASLTSVTLYNNTLRVEGNVNKLTHVVDDKESDVSIIDSKVKYYLVARDADGKEIFKNYIVRVNNGGSYSGFRTNLSLDELNKIQEGKDVTLSLGVETLGTNGELALDGNSLSLPTEIVDSVRNVKYTVSLDGNKVKISKSKNTVTLSESEKVEVEANNAEAIEEAPKSEEVIEENTIVEEATEEVVTEENTAVEEATEEVVTEENTSEVISDKEILELESELLLEGDLIIE